MIQTTRSARVKTGRPGTPSGDGKDRAQTQRERGDFVQRWALVGVWIVVIICFAVALPHTFLATRNIQSLLGSQTTLLVMSFGLMLPLMTGDYDLSIGGQLSLSSMIIAVLNAQHGWPILAAVAAALIVAVVFGIVNGAIIVLFGIDSLIVTLGTGTIATGLVLWISDSQTVSGVSDSLVKVVVETRLAGVPIEFYYGLICCVVLWYLFDFTSLGRRMLFTGRGIRVARLNGVNVSRIRMGSLVASAVLAAVAGILYVGTSSASNPGAGEPLLLPAFAAAFLGTTAISPGRFNPWGTLVAVYFLSTGITGLALLGISSFVQNLFYGGALVIAVVFAKLARRRYVQDEKR